MSTYLYRLLAQHDEARAQGRHLRVSLMLVNGPAVGGVLEEASSSLMVVRAERGGAAHVRPDMIISYIIKEGPL